MLQFRSNIKLHVELVSHVITLPIELLTLIVQRLIHFDHLFHFICNILLNPHQGLLEGVDVLEDLRVCDKLFVEV